MSPFRIRKTKRYGRGLYATRPIKRGEVVEVSPIVVLRDNWSKKSRLDLLVFAYNKKRCCLALGYGTLFNHRSSSNVTYRVRRDTIRFTARTDIRKGEQLFINYGYDPKRHRKLWEEG